MEIKGSADHWQVGWQHTPCLMHTFPYFCHHKTEQTSYTSPHNHWALPTAGLLTCWGCTGLILLLLYSAIYPDPRSDKHPIDTFPQQQSLSWRSCSHALTTCSDPSHLSSKDTSNCLDQEVGFCVHFLNFRLKARTFSITYSCHSSQGFVM